MVDRINTLLISGESTIKRHIADRNTGMMRIMTNLYIVGHVLSGVKEFHVGNNIVRYMPGEDYFMSIGRHFVKDKVPPGGRFEEILLCLNREDILKATDNLQRTVDFNPTSPCLACAECTTKRFIPLKQNDALSAYFNFLDKIMDKTSEITNRMALQLHFAALTFVLFTRMDKCVRGKMLGGSESDDVQFKLAIYKNLFQSLTLDALSASLGYSLTKFKEKFKVLFGSAPHEWILKERLKHSKFLLESTSKSIGDIAKMCCFNSISQYSRNFKNLYGITPSCYRKQKAASDLQTPS